MATNRVIPGGSTAPPGSTKSATTHNVYVALIGEVIGVMALAVIADMNEKVGKIIVVIMVGWFLLFLAINGQWFSQFVGKV